MGWGSSFLQHLLSPALGGPWQVFGKGNTAFWIIFSVIHIIATLLLSIQLYYMGRWKLGEGISRAGHGEGTCWAPWSEGLVALGAWITSNFWVHWGPGGVAGEESDETLASLWPPKAPAPQLAQAGGRGRRTFSLQTRGSAVAFSMCSTQTASGSAAGPSTWYLTGSPAPNLDLLSSLWWGRGEAEGPG